MLLPYNQKVAVIRYFEFVKLVSIIHNTLHRSLVYLVVHKQSVKLLSTDNFYPSSFAVQSSQSANVLCVKIFWAIMANFSTAKSCLLSNVFSRKCNKTSCVSVYIRVC